MSDTPENLKDNFGAAEPVSKDWYNLVARLLKSPEITVEVLKQLQGYNAGAVQALMNESGVIRWRTVNSNCT